MSDARLTAADREFFAVLGEVAFLNPFSAARAELIVRLAPDARLGDLTADREALARVVVPRLAPLMREGALRRRSAEDRRGRGAGALLRHLSPLCAAARRPDRAPGERRRFRDGALWRGGDCRAREPRYSRRARGAAVVVLFPAAPRVLFHRTFARRGMPIDAAPARSALEQRLHA